MSLVLTQNIEKGQVDIWKGIKKKSKKKKKKLRYLNRVQTKRKGKKRSF